MQFNVKEVRESTGLTQKELAEKSGIDRTVINGLETGRLQNTRVRTLEMLANAMDAELVMRIERRSNI